MILDSTTLQDSPHKPQLEQAIAQQKAGQVDSAEATYRQILASDPNQVDALYLYAMIKRVREGVEQALKMLDHALEIQPGHARANFARAICCYQQGDFAEGIACNKRAIEVEPGFADAMNNLGLCYLASGKFAEAADSFTAAIGVDSQHADAYHNLGVLLIAMKKLEAAVGAFMRALEAKPDYLSALRNIVALLDKLSQFDKVRSFVDRAIEARPQSAALLSVLGYVQYKERDFEAAEAAYRKALAIDSSIAECHEGIGNVLRDTGRAEEALEHFEQAITLSPDSARINNTLGSVMKQYGRTGEAQEYYRKAISLDKTMCQAYYNLSMIKSSQITDDEIETMRELYTAPGTQTSDRVLVGYGIANYHENHKQWDKFFESLLEVSAQKRATFEYDSESENSAFDGVKAIFDGGLKLQPNAETDDFTPIFIVGMPRSGTSLAEQILASHPEVYGAGERHLLGDLWKDALKEVIAQEDSTNRRISGPRMRQIGLDYVEGIRALAPEAAYITDKMPENFIHVGLIRALWPNAPIIHTRRNPLDTCVSVFSKHFANDGHRYCYELSELGDRYRRYLDIMDYWNRAFPGQIYELQYEKVTTESEHEIRKLLEYCGLDFHPDCLNFHETKRVVQTASSQQVIQPMYTSSIEVWRRYEKYLGPLIDAIGRDTLHAAGVKL
jgi:tetratricopeptide (TPR) repeat protein